MTFKDRIRCDGMQHTLFKGTSIIQHKKPLEITAAKPFESFRNRPCTQLTERWTRATIHFHYNFLTLIGMGMDGNPWSHSRKYTSCLKVTDCLGSCLFMHWLGVDRIVQGGTVCLGDFHGGLQHPGSERTDRHGGLVAKASAS